MPAAPIAYAASRPAHQYNVQNIKGPRARPACPKRMLANNQLSSKTQDEPTKTPVIAQLVSSFASTRFE
jgi:hypothetical protein